MDVGLTSEQLSLRDTVRDILRTECPPDAARQAMVDPERWRAAWKSRSALNSACVSPTHCE